MRNVFFYLACSALTAVAVPAAAQELIVNGGFEQSTSQTATPTGWTNVGHSDGVIAYSTFATPVYQGLYYYDMGGYGNANGPAGDGIQQTVATSIGTLYTLNFGLSAENALGTSVLNVLFNGVLAGTYTQTADGTGSFKKPFTTQTLSYLATSNATTISFIEGVGANGGNGSNDPLLDGVSFQAASGAVPEPASWAMMILGMGAVGGAFRRRTKVRVAFA